MKIELVLCDRCKVDIAERLDIYRASASPLGQPRIDIEACSMECLIAELLERSEPSPAAP